MDQDVIPTELCTCKQYTLAGNINANYNWNLTKRVGQTSLESYIILTVSVKTSTSFTLRSTSTYFQL